VHVARWASIGGILGALGVCAACCLLPALLVALGFGGAWLVRLDALAPYKTPLAASTLALLGVGFYLTYGRKPACAGGVACATCRPSRIVRFCLWLAVAMTVSGFVYEYFEHAVAR
jgi:mercuric ion transport protein